MRPLCGADFPHVVDIETLPIDGVEEFTGEIRAPSNYKNQEAIDKYVKERSEKEVDKAAIDVDLLRICSIAFWEPGFDAPRGAVAKNEDEEAALIRGWLKAATRKNGELKLFVGFNILQFDLPAIWRRALYLGIDLPWLQLDRFRHPHVMDLMQVLSLNGALSYRSLDFYCKRFGIHVDDDVKGADVPTLALGGDWGSILSHCKADVMKEMKLAERIGVLERVSAPTLDVVPF